MTLSSRTTTLILLGFMIFVGILSLLYFSQQSLRLDEAQSLWQTGRSPGNILALVGQDVHVPLYHELLHFWRLYVGDSVTWARFFSLIWYLLSLPMIYFVGKLAYDRSIGLMAAGLMAISPFMNWYGGEIRMYTLFMFLVLVNQYAYLRLFKGSTQTVAGAEHAWAIYIVSAVFGIYTHYFFFLVLGTQACFYFLRRELFPKNTLKRFLLAAGVVVASFIPWIAWVIFQGQATNASPVLTRPTTVDLFNAFAQFMFGFQSDHLNTVLLSLWPLTLLMAFLALRKRVKPNPETEYLLLSIVVPIIAVFAVSFVVPLFVSRYLIFTVPSLYLVVSSIIASYPRRAAAFARVGVVGTMAVMLVIEMVSPQNPVRENYRAVADYLETHAEAQDVIALSAPFTVYPVEYYYRGEANIVTLPLWDRYLHGPIPEFNPDTFAGQVESTAAGHQSLWLVLSYDQGYQQEVKDYFDQHYTQLTKLTFSPGLDLYEYKVGYETPLDKFQQATASTQ